MKTKKKIAAAQSVSDRSPLGVPALQPGQKSDEFKMIARAELHPDPDQPRKSFDEASLKELAESIAQQGIVQPLIVRLVKAVLRIRTPDLTNSEYVLENLELPEDSKSFPDEVALNEFLEKAPALEPLLKDRYVIVAGERRWRASEIAGLDALPCIVRDVEGHRVFAQQFIENEQRVNITALEEAEALQKQLDLRKQADPKFSVEDLAKDLGMSRAGLYGRLALMRLHAPVREALLAGKISTSVASVVAVIPLPAQQEKLLKEITNEQSWQFPFSVREVQELVEEDYCKQLNDAPFKLDAVVMDANCVQFSCKDCPHRSGNMVDQFPELAKRPNVCTRPDCYAAKCKAHYADEAQKVTAKGGLVLTEKEFKKVRSDYTAGDEWLYPVGKRGTLETLLGKHKPTPVAVVTEKGVQKYYAKTDLPEAFKAAKLKFENSRSSVTLMETPEQKAAREAKENELVAQRERRRAFVESKIPELLKALGKLSNKAAWALGVELVKNHDGYCDNAIEAAAEKAKDDQTRVLGFLFADNDNYPLNYNGDWDDRGVKLWQLAGIDLVKGFEAEEKQAQASLALPAKKAARQGNLLAVKKNKKKGCQ